MCLYQINPNHVRLQDPFILTNPANQSHLTLWNAIKFQEMLENEFKKRNNHDIRF